MKDRISAMRIKIKIEDITRKRKNLKQMKEKCKVCGQEIPMEYMLPHSKRCRVMDDICKDLKDVNDLYHLIKSELKKFQKFKFFKITKIYLN